MSFIKRKLLEWLVPSKWVDWLNGKKRLLGVISLALWAMVVALPELCTNQVCATIVTVATQIQLWMLGVGVNLDSSLLNAGVALTVIGLIDWIVDHWFSKVLAGLFRTVEEPLKKLAQKGSEPVDKTPAK